MLRRSLLICPSENQKKDATQFLKRKKKSISLYPYIETQDFYQVEKEKEEEEDKARRQQIVCGNL